MHRATFAKILTYSLVLSVVTGGSQAAGARPLSAAEILQQHGFAAYQWHGVSHAGTSTTQQRLPFLQSQGFKAVYLDLSDYLGVADQRDSAAKQARLGQLKVSLKRLVAGASSRGLAVQAVSGGPTWTNASRRYLGAKLVQLVAAHNTTATASERLKGVQLDIEPYRDPNFFKDTNAALVDYLKTLQSIVQEYRRQRTQPANSSLQLGFAIPFWFDGEGRAPGPVAFNGTTKPATYHLIDMLKDLPGAYIVVMSYRNFASGVDGSIIHAQNEFQYANSVGAKCGLVVGQEFGKVEPAKVTFNGLSRRAFKKAAEEIAGAFGRFPQFRGLSVNDMDAYTTAKD